MAKEYKKEYVYTGKNPLPEGQEGHQKMTCSSSQNCFPDFIMDTLGYETEKYGLASYFRADVENKTTAILDSYIQAGCLRRREGTIALNIHSDNPEFLDCVYLELPYEAVEKPCDRPTATESISNAINTETDAIIELHCIFDEDVERYLDLPLRTAGPGAISMLDVLDEFSLEEALIECIEKGDMGIRNLRDDDYDDEDEDDDDDCDDNDCDEIESGFELLVFDHLGRDTWYAVESLSEFGRSIVSARLVNVNNKIVPIRR